MPGRTAAEIRMTRDKQDRSRPDPLVASLRPGFSDLGVLDLARRMTVPTDVAIRQLLDRSERLGLDH
jgi:hypothetical protein